VSEYPLLSPVHTRVSLFDKPDTIAEKGFLKIEVVDSGCGISESDIDKVFGKFSQVGDKSNRKFGCGLGLWITYQLCEKMGGGIKVFSKLGKGSTFVAVLKTQSILTIPEIADNLLASSQNNVSHKLRALVVDDNTINRNLMKDYLEKLNFEVVTTVKCFEAFDIFKERGPSYFELIFMDLDMPTVNDIVSCKVIREYEKAKGWPPVNIVIITATCTSDQFAQCMNKDGKIKAFAVFKKPFSFSDCKMFITDYVKVLIRRQALRTLGTRSL